MKFCTISFLSFLAAAAAPAVVTADDFTPNPQQTNSTERPCLAECITKENCYEECKEVCTPLEPPAEGEFCEPECFDVCQDGEVCTFEVGRDELASELGYFEFKGVDGKTCEGGTNPVLGIKKGATYLFTQRRTGNYYHALGFAYGADGALDEQPELEPGICPGTVKGAEDTTECGCQATGLCPAPMYYTGNNYLGEYSNNDFLAPINGESDDFGLDLYEPQFFYPLLQWKATPREEDPEGPGYYQVALHFPEETDYTGDFFYFCHIHQYMTGRLKFVDESGDSISPENTPRIPYAYQDPDAYDRSCGATGIGESQLPDKECPTTFVCDAPDATVAPFAAKFAECVDSMNCAMLKGITTKVSSTNPIALFNYQMIPHHQQAVNMCKALDVAKGTECEDILINEDEPGCILKVLCQEIINTQNLQIQTMRNVLQQLALPETDNCIVEIPVAPDATSAPTAMETFSPTFSPTSMPTRSSSSKSSKSSKSRRHTRQLKYE